MQSSALCKVKRTHFHRISNGFSLKSVVTVVRDRNFTPNNYLHNCTVFFTVTNLFFITAPLLLYGNKVHSIPLISPCKVQYNTYEEFCVGGSKPKTVLYFSYSIVVLYETSCRTKNVIKHV